jgi:hypothetical protein
MVAGRDSSVGIATLYQLNGPGLGSRCERDFSHTCGQVQGSSQPPVKWVMVLLKKKVKVFHYKPEVALGVPGG